ncbi:MAG: CBS domain-containing protein [Devosia sp.]|nr:CBS domain-containing protein [Devosia sp.]
MSRAIVTVMPAHSVRHAAQMMLDHKVSGVPVVDGDGQLVGILTEGDLLRRVEYGLTGSRPHWIEAVSAEGAARDFVKSHSWRVADVMSKPVVAATEDTSLADVAVMFGTRGIKRAPVVRDGRLVGIVSRADLLRIIAAAKPERIAAGDSALEISATARLRDADTVFAACPEVTVVNGVVHLWGRVRSEAERDAAHVAVEGVEGITGIEDHLSIARPG